MSFELVARLGRTSEWTIQLLQADASTEVTVADADTVLIKISSTDAGTPDLELDSDEETSNGSYVQDSAGTNDVTFRLSGADLDDLGRGTFNVRVDLIDDSESGPESVLKHFQTGVLHVLPADS